MDRTERPDATLSVEGIGGIDACDVALEPGVTVLSGSNATNRTSLLTALGSVLGGSTATIKGGQEEGSVTLELGDRTYTRTYRRRDGTVVTAGDPYTNETELVDLFSTLLKDNPVRRAVERGDDLAEVLLSPIDTERIERQIRECTRERDRIDDRIEELERERRRLPDLEERHRERREEREEVRAEIEEIQAVIEESDRDPDVIETAEDAIDELDALRADLEETRRAIDTQRTSIDALRDERDEVAAELEALSVPEDDAADVEAKRSELQQRERSVASTINTLSGIVEFSEQLLDDELDEFRTTGGVTETLDPASELVECWTCGSEVPREDIAEKLDDLRDVVEARREERDEIADRLETYERRAREIREQRERKQALESRRAEIASEIERRGRRIEDLQEEAEQIRERIEAAEARLEESEALRENDLVAQYQRLGELEYREGQLDQEICDLETEIEDLHGVVEERERLERRRRELTDEIQSLRTEIEDLERDLVTEFNDRVADVISLLDYENIERVWIERTTSEGGQEPIATSGFRLNVARTTPENTVYEDTIETLSESEREVIGIVVAVAGNLAHEVYDCVPFVLLDSLEAIDADRIARLVEYLSDVAPYLVVALLTEDAQALDDGYARVSAAELRPAAD